MGEIEKAVAKMIREEAEKLQIPPSVCDGLVQTWDDGYIVEVVIGRPSATTAFRLVGQTVEVRNGTFECGELVATIYLADPNFQKKVAEWLGELVNRYTSS